MHEKITTSQTSKQLLQILQRINHNTPPQFEIPKLIKERLTLKVVDIVYFPHFFPLACKGIYFDILDIFRE